MFYQPCFRLVFGRDSEDRNIRDCSNRRQKYKRKTSKAQLGGAFQGYEDYGLAPGRVRHQTIVAGWFFPVEVLLCAVWLYGLFDLFGFLCTHVD